MKIVSASDPNNAGNYTKYFLDAPASSRRIEVIVLKDYLNQKLGIDFRPKGTTSLEKVPYIRVNIDPV